MIKTTIQGWKFQQVSVRWLQRQISASDKRRLVGWSIDVVEEYKFTTAKELRAMVYVKIRRWKVYSKARGVIRVDFQVCNLNINSQHCRCFLRGVHKSWVGIATSFSKLAPYFELFSPAWIPKEMPRISAFQHQWRRKAGFQGRIRSKW